MDKLFKSYKKEISSYLSAYLHKIKTSDTAVSPWVSDVFSRLEQLQNGGKFNRGSIVLLSHDMFGGKSHDDAVMAAGSIELFETSILIHDDVIDRDPLRRGKPSIHEQYKSMGITRGAFDPARFGQSMAICCADLGLFRVFDLLCGLKTPPKVTLELIALYSREFAHVIYGEMEDVYFGGTDTIPTQGEILRCYQNKTASYSLRLPLVTGAKIAGFTSEVVPSLATLGNNLGILYQIKDDELGIFATERVTGKPVGSDISEGKKTLYYYFLSHKTSSSEWEKLKVIFGKTPVSQSDLETILLYINKLGVQQEIDILTRGYRGQSEEIIQSLPISKHYRSLLTELMNYLSDRPY